MQGEAHVDALLRSSLIITNFHMVLVNLIEMKLPNLTWDKKIEALQRESRMSQTRWNEKKK